MRKRKQIPNMISMLRILLVLCLYVLAHYQLQTTMIVILIITFLTDFFDGFIARKFNLHSEFGAKLDSIGDLFTFVSLPIIFYLARPDLVIPNILVIGTLITLYVLENIAAYILHKKYLSLHLYSSKLSNHLICYFAIYALIFNFNKIFFTIVYFVTIIAILEDLSIQIIHKKITSNMISFFYKLDIKLVKQKIVFLVINTLIMLGISIWVYLIWILK